jgi:hypothetical protein
MPRKETGRDDGRCRWRGDAVTSDKLLPQHAALLAASGISDDVAEARGYRSVTTKAELMRLGFSASQRRVPALLIPVRGVAGEIVNYQVRPDDPRVDGRGKVIKYETVAGSRMVIDVHPAARERLADPAIPLWITEGVRKGDAAVSAGLCCIALLGVWNWRGTNEHGGKIALADFESIALNAREVYIAFDSDIVTKPEVRLALERLRAFLESRDAHVRIVRLPAGPGGVKTGLDDYLEAGRSVDDLLALATTEVRAPDEAALGLPYRATPAGLVWDKPTANGTVAVPLTNFTARIVAQLVEDDGVDQRRIFDIEGYVGDRERRFQLTALEFTTMNWPTERLGSDAVTYAGVGRDHPRVAIQLLSGEAPEQIVYTHLGWREMGGTWVYLHAGGAIGPSGTFGTLAQGGETHLEGALARYMLPDPPVGAALKEALRASLRLLDLAPDHVSVPLVAATYRAVLGNTDFSLHLTGPTGTFKTELAALAQQHYGLSMDSRHLPGSWSSTGNSLEALAFAAKDVLLVIDDFAPAGSAADVQRLQGVADRLFRAQGNRSGRARMRPDLSLRPVKPPRGLVLSTGEDVPRGQSLRARLLVVEVEPADIDLDVLRLCQADGAAGRYAGALAGFVSWVAARYPEIQAGLNGEIAQLRSEATKSRAHRRTPEVTANLALGVRYVLDFALEVGAIPTEQAATLWRRCWTALGEAAASQEDQQVGSDPAIRFVQLLAAAIASGRAHVAGHDGEAPPDPGAWGWRRDPARTDGNQPEIWRGQRDRVGWVVDEALFLEPDASYAAAQSMGRDVDDPLTVQPRTLHRRLWQAGLLTAVEDARRRLTVRRTLEGARRAVLQLRVSALHGTAQTSRTPQPGRSAVGPIDGRRQLDLPDEQDYPAYAWDPEHDADDRQANVLAIAPLAERSRAVP